MLSRGSAKLGKRLREVTPARVATSVATTIACCAVAAALLLHAAVVSAESAPPRDPLPEVSAPEGPSPESKDPAVIEPKQSPPSAEASLPQNLFAVPNEPPDRGPAPPTSADRSPILPVLQSGPAQGSVIPGQYIVVFKDSVEKPGVLAADQIEQHGGQLGYVYGSALKGYSAKLPRSTVEALRNDPRVQYVFPDKVVMTDEQKTPIGISRTFAPGNPSLDIDGVDDARVDADVAVLDTGIDHTHPDLNVVQRVDCVPPGEEGDFVACVPNAGADGDGHGTHVAGTIGAIDNGIGVVGTAPGVRLWSVRVLGNDGTGATSWIVGGINWVAAHSSSIEAANISIGGLGASPPLDGALDESIKKGVVFVVSAGNNGSNSETQHPANSPGVIVVSALADYDGAPGGLGLPKDCTNRGPDDTLANFSNWGSQVDISAPGTCVYSTYPGGTYATKDGTSMASPHVTGDAAVLAGKSNPESKADVETIESALGDAGSLGWRDTSADARAEPTLYLGNGPLVQTEAAVAGAQTTDGTSATLNGAINSRGLKSTYWFEWGPTSAYGEKAAPGTLGSSGYSVVSQPIGQLDPEQTYHYRLAVANSQGTTYSDDRTVAPSRWIRASPANGPAGITDERINDVSCIKPTSCIAAVWYYDTDNHMGSYRLSEGQWQFNTMPTPVGSGFPQTYGISCSTATACTSVGKHQLANAEVEPLVERWNGSTWATQKISRPDPKSTYSRLQDVSCASASECMAVGYYKTPAEKWLSWSALWSNGSWSAIATPLPIGATESELNGVSCSAATRCVAVGSSGSKRMTMSWDGKSWSLDTPAASSGILYGVDCTSSMFCIAVGSEPGVETWTGEAWTAVARPLPSEASGGFLWDVSCKTQNYCAAVGDWEIGDRHLGLTEIWDGTGWSVQTNPHETDWDQRLRGVACSGLSSCVSVGSRESETPRGLILARDDAFSRDPSSITPASAILNGVVDPGGAPTSYQFEYGPTVAYGEKAPAEAASVGAGAKGVDVSQELRELRPETAYHYRLIATNGEGGTSSSDRTFRSATPPYAKEVNFGSGVLSDPKGSAVDATGNLWVADGKNNRVVKFNQQGEVLLQFGSTGTGNGQFNGPMDIAFTAAGDLWVTDSGNDRLQKFNSSGNYLGQFGSSGTAAGYLNYPKGIAVAPDGNIWVSDHLYRRVQEFSPSGQFIRAVGDTSHFGNGQTEFFYPDGVAVDAAGNVWVADRKNNKMQRISSTGQYLGEFGTEGSADGQLLGPSAVDIKPSGDLLVCDRTGGRVQQFTPEGALVSKFKGANEHQGLAVSPNGTAYVSQSNSTVIERWQQAIPKATTLKASGATSSGATLAASVNPRGVATAYRFEYGKTTAYGTKAPVPNESAGSGSSDLVVSQPIVGLEPNTTYHFRVVAINSNGTVYGQDETVATTHSTSTKLSGMALTKQFNGSTASLADFAANWTQLGWAGGAKAKGADTTSGWRPLDAYPAVDGTFFSPAITDTGPGLAAVATMAVNPSGENRYFAVWLDASGPASSRAGYELRFTYVSANTYSVALSRWQGGVQTLLASKGSQGLVDGNSFAIADEGGTISAWINTGSGFNQLMSASDASLSNGNGGLEGSGNITRLTNFKLGQLLTPVGNMDAALAQLALSDPFATEENPLSGSGAWALLSGVANTGRVSGGWGPSSAYPTSNGAFWAKAGFPDTGAGVGVAATLYARPASTNAYFSLWSDMPNPSGARTGYELRFTETATNLYEVTLSKWQAGTRSVLASKTSYSLPVGSQFALVDKGAVVSAWARTGATFTELLSAADGSFNTGYTAIEGAGNITRIKEFKSGHLPPS